MDWLNCYRNNFSFFDAKSSFINVGAYITKLSLDPVMLVNIEIDSIIKILKAEVRQFRTPVVTEVSKFRDPFTVLVSCLLSLRTKDGITRIASERLFSLAKTSREMSKLTVKQIERAIYPVNFYKTKARRIKKISKELTQHYNSEVPSSIDELLKFEGVGRKTANIVVTLGFNKFGIAVDTHVHRISNRLGLVETKTPEQTEFDLRRKLPRKYWRIFNDLLVTYGQNICTPTRPKCSVCATANLCSRVGVKESR